MAIVDVDVEVEEIDVVENSKQTLYMPFASVKQWYHQFQLFENVMVAGRLATICHPYDAVKGDWPMFRVEVDAKNIVGWVDNQYM
jgi:hypothetical protein